VTVLTSAPPRFRSVPLFVSTLGRDAIDLYNAAGSNLDLPQAMLPWQEDVIEGSMGVRADGKWSAAEIDLVVPRQNGKGGILECRQLAGLYLVKTDRVQTYTAHRADTCLGHFERVRLLIEGTPELLELVRDNGRGVDGPSGIMAGNGKESITLADRSKLVFKTRVRGSGRGASGDAVYFDESMMGLSDLGSFIPTMSARPNGQSWFVGSAPLDGAESSSWRETIRAGRLL
jgi:hypothetical protein